MKIYEGVPKHVDELVAMTCDRCGRKAKVSDVALINNFQTITAVGAYGSELIGDLRKVEVDLCESCFDATLGPYWKVVEECVDMGGI
jgi:hypothetical protein